MSFNSTLIVPKYANLIGWRQHYDTNEINLPVGLTNSETGEFYQQKHPALDLEIIKRTIPSNRTIDEFLRTTVTESTNEIFNDLLQYRKVREYGKTILEESTLLNKYGWKQDLITNQNRFVGFQIRVKELTGLKAVITEFGLQMSTVETNLKIYVFHSSKKAPIKTFNITTVGDGDWKWTVQNIELDSFKSELFHGGVFIIGYYQEDLTGNAINYTNFDWERGVCGGCNDPHLATWKSIKNNFHVYPLYVPAGNFTKEEMFNMENVIYTKDQSFGMNLKFSVRCDLTDFFIQNRFAFKNLLAIKVVYKILQMMKFSQNINAVEENIKMMIIRDLEGDIETKLTNIPTQYDKELKSVSFDISGINSKCLGCESDVYEPTYGVV